MHEISLLENVREILQEHAHSQDFKQVIKLTLEIGKFSCVEPDALRFGFDVVMQDTLAEGAELILIESPGKGVCNACGQESILDKLYDPCEFCKHPFVNITQGNDMMIKDLVVI
ncbi:hydrogenase maturation nickel metallochaperone HypA [Methyloprofundus sp.]|uniref:hydrogenase maturation nickel metallochaperone HypA n=1 Tax=Methyloprofundus sp. TaxID=2020875 RepID=UPI003D0EB5C0